MKSYFKAVQAMLTGALATGLLLTCGPALAQPAGLNESCTVSVLNRNVQAKADGTWVLPNIPANFGKVRARATCEPNPASWCSGWRMGSGSSWARPEGVLGAPGQVWWSGAGRSRCERTERL